MKLDLLFELEVPKPWTNGQQKEEQRVYREAIEQIELADKLGFATVCMVEHHFRVERSHCSAPELFLAANRAANQEHPHGTRRGAAPQTVQSSGACGGTHRGAGYPVQRPRGIRHRPLNAVRTGRLRHQSQGSGGDVGRGGAHHPHKVEDFDAEDQILIGDPDQMIRQMERYEKAGVDQLICYQQFGGLPHDKILKSIELLGKYVIPHFAEREKQAKSRAAG